jgi:hypothetical protein
MEKAARKGEKGVGDRPAGGGKWTANAKKMLFRGNKLKALLRIKELAPFDGKNKLVFECKIHRFKAKNCHLKALPAQ